MNLKKRDTYVRPSDKCFDTKLLSDESKTAATDECWQQWSSFSYDCMGTWTKVCDESYRDLDNAWAESKKLTKSFAHPSLRQSLKTKYNPVRPDEKCFDVSILQEESATEDTDDCLMQWNYF